MLSTTGSLASTLGTIQPFRYRGYVYDVETGLYYLRTRYYNSVWDRFINEDVLIKGNLYCYCNNNPINKRDYNGKEPTQYDRDWAIKYGRDFLNGDIRWDNIYYRERSNNCTRFVSACLFDALDPKPKYSEWYYITSDDDSRKNDTCTASWRKAGSFYKFLKNSNLYAYEIIITPQTDIQNIAISYGQEIRADVLAFSWNDPQTGESIHHVGMVSSVDDFGINYMADSLPYFDKPLQDFFSEYEGKNPQVFLIHINDVIIE